MSTATALKRKPNRADALKVSNRVRTNAAKTVVVHGPGPNAFAVKMTPWRVLVCEADVPLKHGCMVVVKIKATKGTCYVAGTLITKDPGRAKSLTVKTEAGWRARRVRPENVCSVTWEHLRASRFPFPDAERDLKASKRSA